MKKLILRTLLLALFAAPLIADAPTPVPRTRPTMTAGAAKARAARPHDDLASAQRALNAAKMFLAKSTNDAGGHRAKAQQAVETALAELKAALPTAK